MHRIITALSVLCLGVALGMAQPFMGQTSPVAGDSAESAPSPQEQRTLDHLARLSRLTQVGPPDDDQVLANVESIYNALSSCAEVAANLKSERILQAIVDFPVLDPDVGEAKMWALAGFKDNPAAHACVIEALQSPEPKIQKNAAHVLFYWKEWDLALPTIDKYGYYEALGVSKSYTDPRLIPILQEGAASSPSWEGRVNAAFYLQFFGDSTTIISVARDVVAHAPLDVDDKSIARAKYTALRSLARCHVTDNISDIARLADDQSALVRIQVVDILQLYAYNDVAGARQALEHIAAENADPDLRETAKAALSKIDR